MTTPTAYPLAWPLTQPRTPPGRRGRALFGRREFARTRPNPLTVAEGLARLQDELRRLGARAVVISTNLLLRLDGLPRSDQRMPEDPGVAVYFTLDRQPTVLACDRWDKVADNLAAIAAHIAAVRGQERWGVGTRAQAFAGYAALPATTARPWRQVLGLDGAGHPLTVEAAEAAYRRLARERHPDTGGSHDAMAELTRAIAEARRELGAGRRPT
jgi:hypothetical protein